ncbi:hypothetical protein Zmor_012807 [Zophobas morio]|uniref:Uncharacterized protein n=1 Tax=Zophobas morio TaxID=2755281 RepID=A0AA38IGQ1_9CUCU|nr:hypothetical protein Zmor_012807 [Zophobas morio]
MTLNKTQAERVMLSSISEVASDHPADLEVLAVPQFRPSINKECVIKQMYKMPVLRPHDRLLIRKMQSPGSAFMAMIMQIPRHFGTFPLGPRHDTLFSRVLKQSIPISNFFFCVTMSKENAEEILSSWKSPYKSSCRNLRRCS